MAQLLIPHSPQTRVRLHPHAVVETVSPAPRDIWRGVLRDDPGATALQTPEYLDAVVSATGGADISRFYQLRDGRQLVLPLVRRPSRLSLDSEAGYPGGYGRGGLLATGGLLSDDVRTVVQDLREESLTLRIGGAPHTTEQWSAGLLPGVTEERRRVGVIDVEPRHAHDVADFRATRMDGQTRQRLHRAAGLGVEMQKDTTGRLMPVVHDVYQAWVERRVPRSGLPQRIARRRALEAESYEMLATVAARMGDDCRVFVAWLNGRPIAASILLVHAEHAVGWRSYSVPEVATPVSADLLTQITSIEDAISSGCRQIDLGPTMGGDDLEHGKNALGASCRSVVDLRIEPAGLARLRIARVRAEGVLVRALTRAPASPTLGQPTP